MAAGSCRHYPTRTLKQKRNEHRRIACADRATMITIGVPAESKDEPRIGLSPETAKKLIKGGAKVLVASGAGLRSHFSDAEYQEAGAGVVKSDADAVKDADIVLVVRRPPPSLVKSMKPGALLIGMLDPYADAEGLGDLARGGAALFAMELMPRISRAQSMDVLSSQANLAGYKAVIDAAALFERALPMMMTAAGTVPAARVFVMGVGVAGLQAIATARRLGAIVSATDVRPAVKEQVASLGAKFIAVEDEEFKQAETAGGYAKEMSDEYKRKQAALIAEHVKTQDIVITTALIPGRPAPRLLSKAMIESMRPGSIIVDLAVERGGNAELARPGEVVEHKGVRIMGRLNLPGAVPVNASSLYARNLLAFVESLLDKKTGALAVNWDDELVKGTLIARDGAIVNASIAGRVGARPAKADNNAKAGTKPNGAATRPKGGKS
jgi:NAD(P) transhydrogenase subunit alpha